MHSKNKSICIVRAFSKVTSSLKWRAILLTSLLLIVIATVYTLASYHGLTEQFALAQKERYLRQARELELSINRSSDNLQQLASIIASTDELGEALRDHDSDKASVVVGAQWPALQLNAGIDSIDILDNENEILSSWGTRQRGVQKSNQLGLLKDSDIGDFPREGLICAIDCRQYSIVPVLQQGESIGLVLVSRSLADVTLYARRSFDSNVALVISHPLLSEDAEHYILPWESSVVAITDEKEELSTLKKIAKNLPLGKVEDGMNRVKINKNHYELSIFKIENDLNYSGKGFFLLFSDVTPQVANIRESTRETLLIALLGWLAAEILLFVILWRPMARLRDLAGALPELANGGFSKVGEMINKHKHFWKDEIFVLDQTALELAFQLEKLEGEVESRGQQLSSRLIELSRERDFIKGLLDTANVLIITQDDKGVITLANQYAQRLTENFFDGLIGKSFLEVFGFDARKIMRDFHHESKLVDNEENEIILTWVHSIANDSSIAHISIGLDITARKHAERRLEWLAHRDPLTELYNRRFFREKLENQISQGKPCAVLYLDLDQFKEVNELSGHHSGDRLLCMVADTLSCQFGEGSVLARQGGDEFSILLPEVNGEEASLEARKIVTALEKIEFFENGRRHRASASIGIALYPEHGTTETDLMASADLAMYKAKESGVNRWHLLSPKNRSKEELKERVYWSEKVRAALEENKLELLIQPIASILTLQVKHYEMLVRMHDGEGGFIKPSVFIPIIERSGQIVDLDRWVLRKGMEVIKALPHTDICFSINISGHSLHDRGLSEWLKYEMDKNEIDPKRVIIEVTETVAVTDFTMASSVLKDIRDLGCQVALDDFGVGFSSFHYLGRLPSDIVKIDGSFVKNISHNIEDRLIVKAISNIAKGFGKEVVAEFVESEEIVALLQEYEVDYAQGYYIGKPKAVSSYLSYF